MLAYTSLKYVKVPINSHASRICNTIFNAQKQGVGLYENNRNLITQCWALSACVCHLLYLFSTQNKGVLFSHTKASFQVCRALYLNVIMLITDMIYIIHTNLDFNQTLLKLSHTFCKFDHPLLKVKFGCETLIICACGQGRFTT